jgi:hypothetical protein
LSLPISNLISLFQDFPNLLKGKKHLKV